MSDTKSLDAGKLKTVSVGLKEGEIEALDQIAGDQKIARNSLMRYIIRRFLVDYQEGRVTVEIEEKTTRSPKMP